MVEKCECQSLFPVIILQDSLLKPYRLLKIEQIWLLDLIKDNSL